MLAALLLMQDLLQLMVSVLTLVEESQGQKIPQGIGPSGGMYYETRAPATNVVLQGLTFSTTMFASFLTVPPSSDAAVAKSVTLVYS